jgi:putative salt-induced outer membrane protein
MGWLDRTAANRGVTAGRSMKILLATCAASGLMLGAAGTAHAELPLPLRAMLDAAIDGGSDGDVDTIAKYLKKTDPADSAEVDRIVADHKKKVADAKQEKLEHQGMFQGWKGEGQIGFSQTSGNTDTLDISAGLKLTRDGLKWRQNLHGTVDYERSAGATTASQIVAAWEPDYKFSDRLFAYGLAQYEHNRFAGYDSRETLSGGIGDTVFKSKNFTVDVKAGPAWQRSSYIDAPSDSQFSAYGALDATWKIGKALVFTENASSTYNSQNTELTSNTALTAKLNKALSARIDYQVTYNSNPPVDLGKTDLLTRFTLVYGF